MKKSTLAGIIVVLCSAVLFLSCATPRAAYKPGYDFSVIRTVRVQDFSSAVRESNSGSVVANEFIRQLLSSGYAVTSTEGDGGDVILSGSVTQYYPNQRFLVQNGKNAQGAQVVVTYPPVEISGSSVYNLGTAFGLDDGSQVVVSNATVGVSAVLKDAATGEVVWSGSYTYEGLDLSTALEGTVRYLINSWRQTGR